MNRYKLKYYSYLTLCLIIYIGAVTAYVLWSYEGRKELLLKDIDRELTNGAKSIRYMLEPDFHDRALGPGSISFREEIKNRKKISGFADDTDFKYVYTLAERDGKFFFSAPTVTEEEAVERKSWYFYPYDDIPPEFIQAWQKKKTVFVNYEDQWGKFRSVAMPQHSPAGRVYLSCADYEISHIDEILASNIKRSVLTSLYFIIFSVPFIVVFRLFFSSYLKRLKSINDELNLHKSGLEDIVRRRTEELSRTNRALKQEKSKLEEALLEVKTLSGLLPICASCKKIRDDSGYWDQIENYIEKHSDAQFSHGMCPECIRRLYPEFAKEYENQSSGHGEQNEQ